MAVKHNKLLNCVGDYIGEHLHRYKGNSKGYSRMEGEYPQNNKVGKRGLFPTLESNFIGEGLVAACWMVVKFTGCCGQCRSSVSRQAGDNTVGCRWAEEVGQVHRGSRTDVVKEIFITGCPQQEGPWQGSILARAKGFYVWHAAETKTTG